MMFSPMPPSRLPGWKPYEQVRREELRDFALGILAAVLILGSLAATVWVVKESHRVQREHVLRLLSQ